MNYIEILRQLAKSDEYQNIYALSREVGSIKLFENPKDFTHIQMVFLKYLNFYYNLYTDIAMGEVSEIVLENNIYSDSYVLWKNRHDKEKFKEDINFTQQKKEKYDMPLNESTWIFKNPKNKVK